MSERLVHFCPITNSLSELELSLNVTKPLPKRQILDSSKLKELVDDNFKLGENCRKLSKWVENTEGKEEIARYEQFLLFPTVFSKDMYCRHVKTRACLGKV